MELAVQPLPGKALSSPVLDAGRSATIDAAGSRDTAQTGKGRIISPQLLAARWAPGRLHGWVAIWPTVYARYGRN